MGFLLVEGTVNAESTYKYELIGYHIQAHQRIYKHTGTLIIDAVKLVFVLALGSTRTVDNDIPSSMAFAMRPEPLFQQGSIVKLQCDTLHIGAF